MLNILMSYYKRMYYLLEKLRNHLDRTPSLQSKSLIFEQGGVSG